MRAAAASTPWALITARASPRWCWTAPGAAASPTKARASVAPPPPPGSASRPRRAPPPRSTTPPHAPFRRGAGYSQAGWPGVQRSPESEGSRGARHLLAGCTCTLLIASGPRLPFGTLGALAIASALGGGCAEFYFRTVMGPGLTKC